MTEIKVILIEDDKSTRLGIEQALDLAGFKVESHPSASLALPGVTAGSAAVVVSDVKLRGIDGLELQQRLLSVDRKFQSF